MRDAHTVSFEPHTLVVEDMFQRLASASEGITSGSAAERLAYEGPNILPEAPRLFWLVRFGTHLVQRFALLLWVGAALAFLGERFSPGQGMLLIGIALIGVVCINATFTFWQELRVEHAMAAFRRMLAPHARVIRDGVEVEINAAQLVVGDVILLREGDRVPADARLFDARALKVDNSPLTGECEPQLRTVARQHGTRLDSRNLVFSGTLVTTGSGRALVYATGSDTEIGQIAGMTQTTARVETPIHRELRYFIRVISAIALGLGVIFFVAGWAIGNPFWTNLVFAIGIIVANVPEGLLPTVSLGLAIAARKMAKRKALLKTLESAETLGSTTVICTDKTGTLTQNEMRVTDLLLAAPDGGVAAAMAAEEIEAALRIMVLCNNAKLETCDGRTVASGDPTETALLLHAERVRDGSVAGLRAQHARIHEVPFDSTTREMATVNEVGGGLQSLLKGAPERVVEQCNRLAAGAGAAAMTTAARQQLVNQADSLARGGKRVLALACKPIVSPADFDDQAKGGGYTFVGLVAFHDPPRPEVAAAVARCRGAGVRIVVISGDHPLTVEAIARQTGITTDGTARTGAELQSWSAAALRRALDRETVLFARASPLDKLRIVTTLQEMGHVVAVTGDGVNDAPALKRADIGVAMGRSGTDVAREAASMVLMDDNFSTIVAAVEEGRVVYANIRRFIGYVLTSNVPEILPYIVFVLLGIPLPLPVLLILAIDLGTDMAPAVGLATERAETDVMRSPPRPRTERLLTRQLLLSSYVLWGLLESAAGFAAYLWILLSAGWRPGVDLPSHEPLYGQAIGAYFAAVVICQVANVILWRTTHESVFVKGFLRNRAVLAGIFVECALLWLIVETDVGHAVFGTAALPPVAWLVPVPFAVAMLGVSEALKALARRRMRRSGRIALQR